MHLFVVPMPGEIPSSFNFVKLEGDLVDILSKFRSLGEQTLAYAQLTTDQLSVLIESRNVLSTPDLVMITELGVDYPSQMVLLTEFMDIVSIRDLEEALVRYGLTDQAKPDLDSVAKKMGINVKQDTSEDELYNSLA